MKKICIICKKEFECDPGIDCGGYCVDPTNIKCPCFECEPLIKRGH
jgi:hypothetical protein